MTTHHDRFDLVFTEHRNTPIPGILGDRPVHCHSATVSIVSRGLVVCRWDEVDVDAALRDFENRESFDVGLLFHIDVLYSDECAHVMVWAPGEPDALHIISVAETEFFERLADARHRVEAAVSTLA